MAMRAGNAIRDARRDEGVCICDHSVVEHRELPYGSEGYKPAQFVCHASSCECTEYEKNQ